jgi:predicted Rossmann fold flavoprotein
MAAGQAALAGASVLLLEKMPRPARKLRITGKGRCNLTNVAPLPEFIAHFGPNGVFLRQAFARFFAEDLVAFFAELGVRLVTERGGRVFPETGLATEIADALVRWVRAAGVTLRASSPVAGLLVDAGRVRGARVGDAEIPADAVILATGGASYPATGSTGDGFRLAGAAGHTIVPTRPALVPLETAGDIAPRLQGLSLRNVTARLLVDGRVRAEVFGEMLFTHFGLSGPIILTLSRAAVDALESRRKVTVGIDLKPALDDAKLDERLQRDIREHGRRSYRALLGELLPRKLVPVGAEITGIPAEKPVHQLGAAERKRLRAWLKDFRLEVTGHRGWNEAVVTAGGVATREVDPRTMESRIVAGLHLAGEVLDLDADTGGYNLQAAFSTGWLAGRAAAGPPVRRRE